MGLVVRRTLMILTGEQIVNAMNALVSIGTRQLCLIPSMAKFALAKQHDHLMPTYTDLMKKQQELIQIYGEELFSDPEKTKPTGQWGIKDEVKKAAYEKEWGEIGKVEFNLPLLTPISTSMLGNDPRGLEMRDFVLLGPLVHDPSTIAPTLHALSQELAHYKSDDSRQGELFSEVK